LQQQQNHFAATVLTLQQDKLLLCSNNRITLQQMFSLCSKISCCFAATTESLCSNCSCFAARKAAALQQHWS
jgi:hypothetical protein